ncbi:MAG: hypothetical protein AAFX50_12470, partial [Acidobacteriota bacterium]
MYRPLIASFSMLLSFALASDTAAQPSPVGAQFQVNTYTTGGQYDPSVASDAVGNFVISWSSGGSPSGDPGYSILAQRYSPGGTPIGDEFQANAFTSGAQVDPAIAMGPNGDFVLTWATFESPSFGELRTRLFLPDGTASGDDFQTNTYTTGRQILPTTALDSGGGIIVAWTSEGSAGTDSDTSVQTRRLGSDGGPIGSEFQVNTSTQNAQAQSDIAVQPGDDFLVTWTDFGGVDGAGGGIVARRFASDGSALGDEIVVNTYTTGDQSQPAVATDASGAFTVVWQSSRSAGGDIDGSIQGQRFDALGQRLGGQFQVNTVTTGTQRRADVVMAP